jgi:phenylacetate-CoA ligase
MAYQSLLFSNHEYTHGQMNAIKQTLKYVAQNSIFYKDKFSNLGVDITAINSVDEFVLLPVTTKDELQSRNWDFFCVANDRIIDFCSTSGTLGAPVLVPLSNNDLARLSLNEYRSFATMGVTEQDVVHLMLSLDRQFMAGLAYLLGARERGVSIVRGGPGNPAMQIDLIKRLKSTVIVAVPSFVVSLIAYAYDQNIDLNNLSVKKVLCIGENIRNEDMTLNALASRIQRNWDVELYSTYASSEMQTAFTECHHGAGGHHQPDLIYVEILDENNKPVKPGEYGELTITTLGVEAMPLVRYKTGDVCKYFDDPCKCGRPTLRVSPVRGRKQQLIKYKGTSLYPQTIFNALDECTFINDYVVRAFTNDMGTDGIEVIVSTELDRKVALFEIQQKVQSKLRVVPTITIGEMGVIQKMHIQEGKRKPSRFIDERVSMKGL